MVVRKKTDLEALSRAAGILGMPQVGKLVFELEGPKRAQQLVWERRLNAYLARCGCTAGAVATLLSLAGGFVLVSRHAGEASVLDLILWVSAAAVGAMLFGLAAKIAVLLITRVQIRATVKRILRAT
jgi:hypothetical protein